MPMPRWIFTLACLLALPAAADATLDPSAFAEGFRIDMTAGSPIYRLRLPERVYTISTRRDLGDVRVFNHAGDEVPHAIRRQRPDRTESMYTTDLPMFPVYGDLARRDISISGDGNIIGIQQLDSIEVDPRAGVKYVIIDLSHLDVRVSKLEFQLSGVDAGFLGRAMIESSEDLDYWRTVVGDTAIAVMNYGDHRLIKNAVELPEKNYRYLRFTWLARKDNVIIDSVRALHSRSLSERELVWSTLPGVRPDADRAVYEFENRALLPIEAFEILLPEHNTLIDGSVRSRRDDQQERWQHRYSGSFYRLDMQGVELKHGPVDTRINNDRYWQLELSNANGLGQAMPQLRVAWEPGDVFFLARGAGPFTLVYGNANVREPAETVQALLKIINNPKQAALVDVASAGEPLVFRGAAALQADRVIPWERLLLWGVLGLGVVIVGFMALRLFRQMNA